MKVKFFATMVLLAVALAANASARTLDGGHGGHDDNEAKFRGTIESLPATAGFIGDWRVSGRTVHVTSATRIEQEDGRVAVGAMVKVEGTQRADGSVDASEIEVKEAAGDDDDDDGDDDHGDVHFTGTIESLPSSAGFVGDWRVGGRTIHVSASTRIEAEHGPVAVGALAKIEGTPRTDGSLDASEIEIKSNVAGDDGRDELKGTIESLPASGLIGDWRVSGRTVHVSATTVIDREHGLPVIGAFVEASGILRSDGSLDATRIEVQTDRSGGDEGRSDNFKGTIQSLPSTPGLIGDWMVDGRLVHVVSSTRLKTEHGPFAVGTRVKVKGLAMTDGSTVATKIQVKDN